MELVAYLLGYVEIIVFAWGIVQMRFCRSKVKLSAGVFAILGCGLMATYCDTDVLILLMLILVLPALGCTLLFDEKFVKSIVKYCFCFSYVGFIYLPVGLIITSVGALLNINIHEDVYDIIRSIVSVILMLCLAYFIKKKRALKEWIQELPTIYFVIAFICGCIVGVVSSYGIDVIKEAGKRERVFWESMRTLLNIAIYTLGIGFSLADFLRKKYRDESRLKDEYLRMSREHYDGLVTHMKEIRSIRHDMRAHINMIGKYIKDKDITALEAYVNELSGESSLQTVKYYNTGNEIADAVLTDGMRRCKDDEVRLECKGSLEDGIKISDYDLCIIMSNLLSNVIEACEKLAHSEKLIKVLMESNERTVRIVFENPVEWEVDLDKLGTYTSKADKNNHGLGINNVKRTVEKYNGTMVMSCENDKFRTIIVINI